MQNFATRVLTDPKKFDHISTVLRGLGCLLVRDAEQMYKIVNGFGPSYLSSFIGKRSDVHDYNTRQMVNLDLP